MNFCKSNGMELLTLETSEEDLWFSDVFRRACFIDAELEWFLVGGIRHHPDGDAYNREEWFWQQSGRRVNYGLNFVVGEPNNVNGTQWCLAINRYPYSVINRTGFADIECSGRDEWFFCQEVN